MSNTVTIWNTITNSIAYRIKIIGELKDLFGNYVTSKNCMCFTSFNNSVKNVGVRTYADTDYRYIRYCERARPSSTSIGYAFIPSVTFFFVRL
jgi:hypothetical protein